MAGQGSAIPAEAVAQEGLAQALQTLLQPALEAKRLPGAVVCVQGPGLVFEQAFGQRAAAGVPAPPALAPSGWSPLKPDAIYDCASLTKVVVTAPLMARLLHERVCALDDPVGRFLPVHPAAAEVSLRQLLTHSSGHAASLPLSTPWQGLAAARELAMASLPTQAPGSLFRYSDINFILLDAVAECLAGQPLDTLAQQWLFEPLGMADTGFLPLRWAELARLVPTELDAEDGLLLGRVHDPTCRSMGGVAGHAGLFSTVSDLARYATCLLQDGAWLGRQVLPAAAVAEMLRDTSPPGLQERRGAGWDLDSPYSRARGAVYARGRSFGHTGFTGCALWLDLDLQGFHVLLSNRVHPQARQGIVDLYEAVASVAGAAVRDAQRAA
jgi:CubicO group peptidase (beta-lactamase class C family)